MLLSGGRPSAIADCPSVGCRRSSVCCLLPAGRPSGGHWPSVRQRSPAIRSFIHWWLPAVYPSATGRLSDGHWPSVSWRSPVVHPSICGPQLAIHWRPPAVHLSATGCRYVSGCRPSIRPLAATRWLSVRRRPVCIQALSIIGGTNFECGSHAYDHSRATIVAWMRSS